MSRSKHHEIRVLLRAMDDGMTAAQISITLDIPQDSVRQSLANMPDVYIDRWIKPTRGPYSAVWCAVSVPEHCPRPADDA
jgi:hypothetical protein